MTAEPAPSPCPRCGYEPSNDELPAVALYRPWHVRDRAALREYVRSLGKETHEWLLVLYVDARLQLLAVDTAARGSVSGCRVPFNRIMVHAWQLKASAYFLVHNHPSGDPRPSEADVRVTARLAQLSADLDVPLLDHLIIAGDEMISCG